MRMNIPRRLAGAITPRRLAGAITVAAVFALGGCANTGPAPGSYSTGTNTTVPQTQYGVVQAIELVRLENTGIGGSGIGAGTIIGAVVGGVVGNQVGKGSGNTAATVLGAAGGAYAGNQIEKRNQQSSDAFRITVRMNDGSYQTVTQTSNDQLRVGDRVMVANSVAQRY